MESTVAVGIVAVAAAVSAAEFVPRFPQLTVCSYATEHKSSGRLSSPT